MKWFIDLFNFKKRKINVLFYITREADSFSYSINVNSFFSERCENYLAILFLKNYSKRNIEDYDKILSVLTSLDSDYKVYTGRDPYDVTWVIWKDNITIEKFEEAIKPKLIKNIKDLYAWDY
jgi:hypothetical protein